jgi:D-arabinose 1-dehydrogenase-like Zn-dependent alcohol dehydrogenase
MPAIINSAPDCITSVDGAKPADDSADFIIQAAYEDCAGIMTFGPGSTYGEDGAAAAGSYYVLIGIGAVVILAVFIAWIAFENRRLLAYAAREVAGRGPDSGQAPAPTA